jgi:hypothetical protein
LKRRPIHSGFRPALVALALTAATSANAQTAQTDCSGAIGCMPLVIPPYAPNYTFSTCQPDFGEPIGNDWVLPFGTSWVNCNWIPDRRPFAYLQFFNPAEGAHVPGLGNPPGLKPWWHPIGVADYPMDVNANSVPDQFETLLATLDDLYAEGFRRIVLQLPAGAPFGRMRPADPSAIVPLMGVQVFSMNQWNAMAQFKQDWFTDPDSSWGQWVRAHQSQPNPADRVKLELYMGSTIADGTCTQCVAPNEYTQLTASTIPLEFSSQGGIVYGSRWITPCAGVAKAIDFDPRNPDHVEYVLETILPWRAAGVTSFWLDAASRNANKDGERRRWGAIELAYMPGLRAAGVSFGMESLPVYNSNERPDWCTVYKMPCVTTQVQAMGPYNGTGQRFRDQWWFDRTRTEVHYLHFDPVLKFQDAAEARRRGMILTLYSTANSVDHEIIRRWYSMGPIWIADFNGDGTANLDDLALFDEVFNYSTFDLRVFANGDIDGDGLRTPADRVLFLEAMLTEYGKFRTGASPQYVRDFGAPNDM